MSTSLQTYEAVFLSDADYASTQIQAQAPEAALTAARAFYKECYDKLLFSPYDTGEHEINEISIRDQAGVEVAQWRSGELILREAASELLRSLERALVALNTAPRFRIPKLQSDSYAIAAECGKTIANAKGDAE
jgi:hypothetical protein